MSRVQRTRLIVRLSSLILSLLIIWSVLDVVRSGNIHPINLPFQIALIAVAVASLASWRWERAGGLALILCGVALGLAVALTIAIASSVAGNPMPLQALAGLAWAVPFVIFGLLFRSVATAGIQPGR
jgi:hypothetical protein